MKDGKQARPGGDKPRSLSGRKDDRRAEFRVGDDQRSGHGVMSAWSRMSMLERRKRLWADIRRDPDAPEDEPTQPDG